MASWRLGLNSKVQIGMESVWGTEVDATRVLPVLTVDAKVDEQKIESEVLNAGLVIGDIYLGPQLNTITMDTELWYESMLTVIEAAMGQAVFGTHRVPTGGPAYAYGFGGLSLLPSYTIEIEPGSAAASESMIFTGAKINEVVITAETGKAVKMRTTWFAKEFAHGTPTGALTLATPSPVLWSDLDVGNSDDGSTTLADQVHLGWELTIRNFAPQNLILGSRFITEPTRDGFCEYLMRFRMRFQTKEIMAAYIANDSQSPVMYFTDGSSIMSFALVGGANIRSVGRPINKPGGIEQDFEWKGVWNGSNALVWTVTNSEATIT